jgi:hypothetical protein
MGGGGKGGTTTQTVKIPPEVLARYNAVNARAEDVAKQPFQPYTGQFVAPLTGTQQAGIQQTQQASQAAQPYYASAVQQLLAGQQAAQPGIAAAYQGLGQAQNVGSQYAQAATGAYGQAQGMAMPYYQAASQGLGQAVSGAQPYQQMATGFGLAGSQAVNPAALNVGQFMSPYTQAVAQTTQQALAQQQGQERAMQQAQAIRSGAFGGERAGLERANLARQQSLGMAQALAPIYQQGFGQALATAQQQQGVGLGAEQANRAALQQTAQQMAALGQQGFGQQLSAAQQAQAIGQGLFGIGSGTAAGLAGLGQQQFGQGATAAQQLAGLAQQQYGMGAGTAQALGGLGTGAQAAALQGAQAQLGAGTLEQQTQQADLTANYQQFLQERGYPFQVAQFLANIAMGTGALSGSTTQTTQPTSFFSDERLKENIQPIGETFDGQKIYKYNYKGEPGTQIGLLAQEVEREHPEAVGESRGFKTVDYDRATEEAGGLGKAMASMGGAVREPGAYARGGYAPGGLVDPNDLQALLASQKAAFGPFSSGGPYGQSSEQAPFAGSGGIVPTSRLPTPKLMTAGAAPRQQEGGLRNAMREIAQAGKFTEKAGEGLNWLTRDKPTEGAAKAAEGAAKAATDAAADPSAGDRLKDIGSFFKAFNPDMARGGGVRPHYAAGGAGSINPYDAKQDPMDYFPEEVLEEGDPGKKELPKPGQPPGGGGGGGLGSALGTAASAISAAGTIGKGIGYLASLLPFSDARLKHDIEPIGKTYDGQNIYRYHMGDGVTRMGLMAQEVAERNPDAVGRGPGGFLTLDYDKATGEAVPYRGGLKPREGLQAGGTPSEESFDIIERFWPNVERTESGGKQFDPKTGQPLTSSAGAIGVAQVMPKTAPEAARLAGVDFDDARYRTDPDYNRKLGQAYLREQYRTFGDPALALAAYNAGPGNVRAALAKAQESGGSFVNYLPTETQQYLVKTGAMPGDAVARASGVKPRGESDFFGGPPVRFGTKTPQNPQGEQFKSYPEFFTSRQFVQPALIGLATMASSPSRYLGSAILQGLGGGAQAYSNLEKQMADVGQTQQQTAESRARTISGLSGIQGGTITEFDPITGKPVIKLRPEYFGGDMLPKATEGLKKTQEETVKKAEEVVGGKPQRSGPLTTVATDGRYNFSVAPTETVDNQFAQFGYKGQPTDRFMVKEMIRVTPGLNTTEIKHEEAGAKRAEAGTNINPQRVETNLLVDQTLGITPEGLTGRGPGQFDRAKAVDLFNYAARLVGVPGLQNPNVDNITAAQVINKIQTNAGAMQAQGMGFHANALAEAMREAQISGSLTEDASIKLAASTYAMNQMREDFSRYYNAYIQKYGTALNVEENFAREMGGRYEDEKKAIETALKPVERVRSDGTKERTSWAMELRKNPAMAQQFDERFGRPGLARMFLGG